MNKEEYFSSPVYYEEKPEWVNKLDQLSDPYIEQARKNEEKTNRKRLTIGYKNDIGMTYHSQPLEPDKNFKFFHDYMAKKSRWVLDDMGYDMDNYSLIYTESWVQEFSENGAGHHWFHTHSNCHISGFYFLKCSDKTSYPIFHEPRTGARATKLKMKPDQKGVWGGSELIHFKPTPGTLIIFPGYLEHEYAVDFGIEPFRFIHWNIQAVPKEMAKDV